MIRLLPLPALCFACLAASTLPAADPTGELPHQRLLHYADDAGNEQPVRTKSDWEIRRRQILQGMEEATGPLPDRNNLPSLDIEVLETVQGEGYERQTVRFTTEPGDRLTAYLYVPAGASAGDPRPGIVALHPTHRIGKGVVDGQSERPNRAYGKELAERGYVVIAPDYISFGDSADYDFENDRYRTGTMKGIWNHMRCVDLLQQREDVIRGKIGTIGHSLGGHNAIFLGVFDERVQAIVSSCGWTPFHDYYGGKIAGWTSDRYMPSLKTDYDLDPDRVPFDFYELVAALAPRPFFSNSPLHDSNFDYRGVEKAIPKARRVYELYDAANNLRVVYPNAQHDFPPAVRFESYRFLDEHLGHTPRNGESGAGTDES
ncbi:Alpha/beta hydrolase family protein [Maioricimonas rarisocia]|uniref:Alpha/beta hydrolase family protein n=1 Tax=Maioricimonas rarisocia TaxID=2528026 RepID=A0A517Z5W5_9PLAN|nr:alpha/beta fold hydrolase [Maioricimonas rarisocia]QDU37890.1 Alpha/beta hydrolase family protein [Maioricimonas rarisocia]